MIELIYTLFMGAWRDGFGKDGWRLPVYKNRFVQHIIAFVATFLLCTFCKDVSWLVALWIALWIQIEWALAIGPAYDEGTGGKPNKKMLERYEKMVGYKWLCKVFPESLWHSMGFDFCLLAIRYTYPLLPICVFFNPIFLMLGLIVSSLYLIYRYCPFCQKHRLLDVEIWTGLVVGLFVACL